MNLKRFSIWDTNRMVKTIIVHKHLIYNLVITDIKCRYWGSFFGLLGSIINPLLILLIYTFVFSGILKIKFNITEGMGNFAIYLFGGFLPWMGFSEAVQRSSTVLLDQRAIIKRTKFPKDVLIFSNTLSAFTNQCFALFAFVVVLLCIKYNLTWHLLLLPFIFPIQIFFTYGICLIISSLNIFFRDIGIFLATFLQLWFFCTPIFYPETIIPKRFLAFMEINPLFHLVKIYRSLLLQGSLPPSKRVIWFLLYAFASSIIGFFIFNKLEGKIVDYL